MVSQVGFILFISFTVLVMVVSVAGKECRTSATVEGSAQNVEINTAAKGHIWQHVNGLESRPRGAQSSETQEGKSLFASECAYKDAWKRFHSGNFNYLTPKQCKGSPDGQMVDCVLASDIGVTTAYKCLNIDRNTKLCTEKEKFRPRFVEFWYAQKGGKWVLNTAYPSSKNTPTHACLKIANLVVEERNNMISENLMQKLLKFEKI